ncbi:MAG TPA: hypothetical protein VMW42_08875, partial [Desulfatiglandales bacterium]|nr:hypothetical protein [Desulfatiglandales bacterium]
KYDPVLKPLKPAEPEGYLGAIDSTGSRVIAITRSLPLRGFMAVISITNDLAGIQEFNLGEFTKKSFNEFLKGSLSSAEFPIVAAPGAYCVRLLKENASLSKKLLKPLPQGYHDFENEFGDVQWNAPGPIIYQHIKEDELKDNWRLLKDSGTLHQINPFSTWFLNAQDVRKYVSSIKESQESRIVLLPDQKEARLNNIYRRALEELFPEEIRLLWKTRLEEMAYILLETGKEKEAKTAVRAAIDLKNPFSAIDPNPFIWNLLLKSIYVLMDGNYEKTEKEKESSIIITS